MLRNIFVLCSRISSSNSMTMITRLSSRNSNKNLIEAKVISRKNIGLKYRITKTRMQRQKEEKQNTLDQLLDEPHIVENYESLEQSLINDSFARRTAEELTQTHKAVRNKLKYQIWKKKYMREEPEIGVLTWSAKEQIHFLHNIDPEKWSYEVLAEHFPITANGVRKLLKSSYKIYNKEDEIHHDQKVLIKWKKLISLENFESLHPGYKWLFNEGKSSLFVYANGNSNLPMPPKSYIELMEEKECKRVAGPYESLVRTFYISAPSNSSSNIVDTEKEAVNKEICSIIDLVKVNSTNSNNNTAILLADGINQSHTPTTEDVSSTTDIEFKKFMQIFSPVKVDDTNNIPKKKVLQLKNNINLPFSKNLLYKC